MCAVEEREHSDRRATRSLWRPRIEVRGRRRPLAERPVGRLGLMSTTRSTTHLLVGAIVLLGLGVAGLGIGGWGLAQIADDRDWVPVDARVVRVEAEPYEYQGRRSGGGTYVDTGTRIKVWYAYEADGRAYSGSRYSRLEPWDDYTRSAEAEARSRLRALATGTVQAWVDPDDPASAVLARSERAAPIAVTGVALILISIGVGLLIARRRG